MLDKRFWSGAIIVTTIVVAGASALPALLIGPAAPEPTVPATPVSIAKRAELVPRAEPPVAKEVPAPGLTQPEATPPAQISASQRAELASVGEPEPVAHDRDATPVTFPPVQPVGVAAKAEPPAPAALAASTTPDPRPVTEKPVRAQRIVPERVTKRKRQVVRPAVYPLREFFAFRR
jgi:hypothetical protein